MDSERVPVLHEGSCTKGICIGDSACQNLKNGSFTCICTSDSKPPLSDGSCPRKTVDLAPQRIPNVHVPSNSTNPDGAVMGHTVQQSTMAEYPIYTKYYFFAGGVVVLFIFILISFIIKRKCFSRHINNSVASPMNLKQNLLSTKRYAPNPQYTACAGEGVPLLRKETFKFLHEIGEGCFGKVFKGEYRLEGTEKVEIVAIKVLKDNASREAEEDFLREVEIMSAFRHPNILTLLGVVPREGLLNPMMVFEYMAHGDLAELLRAQKRGSIMDDNVPQLNSNDLLFITLQISRGMSYLASQRFVHRDLACRNCLVSEGPVVKIADFGMSRDVYTCDYYKIGGSRLLPVRWMSPESVIYGRFTLESDIWSFGVVMWEIYSYGKQPYYGHTNEEVVKLILDGIMLIPPIDCPSFICELMKNCWKTEPRDRIRFSNICDKLEVAYDNCESHDEFEVQNEKFDSLKMCTSSEKPKIREDEIKQKLSSLTKPLPRPPPMPFLMNEDLLDTQGYLLQKEMKQPVLYLETLPG